MLKIHLILQTHARSAKMCEKNYSCAKILEIWGTSRFLAKKIINGSCVIRVVQYTLSWHSTVKSNGRAMRFVFRRIT